MKIPEKTIEAQKVYKMIEILPIVKVERSKLCNKANHKKNLIS